MTQAISKCPICGSDLNIVQLHCRHCDTTIEGHFDFNHGPFGALTPEQMAFLLTFIRCEGRFTRMEEEMKLSYPTLRNRLSEVIRALGFEPSKDETPPAPARPSVDDRRRILDELSQGIITADQARRLLQGLETETQS